MPRAEVVTCPQCNGVTPFEGAQAGQIVSCPYCRAEIRVPGASAGPAGAASSPFAASSGRPAAAASSEEINPYASPRGMSVPAGPAAGDYGPPIALRLANKQAGEALACAIIGFFFCWPILEPMAIFKATNARKTLERYPGAPGSGKATAALIIAWVTIGIGILGFVIQFVAMMAWEM